VDELVGCGAAQGLEPASVIVGIDEELEVRPQLLVGIVVAALDGGVLNGAVHTLDLAVDPGMVHLGQPVLDAVLAADAVEDVLRVPDVPLARGEMDAVIGQDGMDLLGDGLDQLTQELSSFHFARVRDQADEGELARAIGGHEEAQLSFLAAEFGKVDVELADGIGAEALPGRFVSPDLGPYLG
jgi:hypothetical protein